eukprot:3721872-Alexandrium_andersonii.AAC.1
MPYFDAPAPAPQSRAKACVRVFCDSVFTLAWAFAIAPVAARQPSYPCPRAHWPCVHACT